MVRFLLHCDPCTSAPSSSLPLSSALDAATTVVPTKRRPDPAGCRPPARELESSTGDSDSTDSSGVVDGVLDIGIIAHNDCTFTVEPASITVTEGTAFTVNWVSSPASEVEFDIAKIDPFNQVPIVIGMEPATAYHDDIREWCGDIFTGTFEFRLTSCYDPLYIPVDCGG